MESLIYLIFPLIIGFFLDKIFGDPNWLPHPIVLFGVLIKFFDNLLNDGEYRIIKGCIMSLFLIFLTYTITYFLITVSGRFSWIASSVIVFYCLSGKTLIKESKMVMSALNNSLELGRAQLSRIVGRDTSDLNEQEIRKATLETLSENLSDGVIAPLFWYLVAGAPGMITYKMVNTLDSMIGYKSKKYLLYGKFAAKTDDVANYIPARLTALLMAIVSFNKRVFEFVNLFGRSHSSPNSGYPESALAGILDCRLGGPSSYLGVVVEKPYIGLNNRVLTDSDLDVAVKINVRVEILMIVVMIIFFNVYG